MKKLIIFSYDFPPSDGGIARLCNEIAVGINKYYSKVTVLTRKKEGHNIPYNTADIEIIMLPNQRIKCEIAAFKYLLQISNKQEYIVVCGLWHPEGSLALMAGFGNVNILAHGNELRPGNSNFKKYLWFPLYCKKVLGKASRVIANSNFTKGLVLKINQRAQCVPIPLGVNADFFKPSKNSSKKGKLILCTVSRILQYKGHDFIMETIAGLPDEYKNRIQWHIGGTGSYLSELVAISELLHLEGQISFHGFVKDSELPNFYNQADVFILCTRELTNGTNVEGFGLVFLEAQACGIPTIGTRSGGISDAVDHLNGGWLIESDNKVQLSSLLKNLIDNQSLVKEMGELARARVEANCTWEKYCRSLNKVLYQ